MPGPRKPLGVAARFALHAMLSRVARLGVDLNKRSTNRFKKSIERFPMLGTPNIHEDGP